MNITKIFILILIILICLGGCMADSEISDTESENSITESEGYTENSPATSEFSEDDLSFATEDEIESEEETSATEEPEEDLLLIVENHDKDIFVYGDLKSDEYSQAINRLEAILDGYDKNISLVIYSLDNSRAISYNTNASIFPASMIKAPYSLFACMEMEKGRANLETQMVYESKHYEIGTGDLQYSQFGDSFKMSTIIDKTMGISDNVGYLMMVDYFGRDGYNQWIESIDASSLKIKPTVWSLRANARDFALIWREIYKYFQTESDYADFLYDACTNTGGNFATTALGNITYSHKQGHQRSGDWHSYSDAGIVWDGDESYLFAIMTDAPGPSAYEERIFAEIMTIVNDELF